MAFSERLERLHRQGHTHLLKGGLKGLEKESLRLNHQGQIATTPHPQALGSALTHPEITTDYSEALVELITPAFPTAEEALTSLGHIHRFVYQHLGDESLLATSMPIGLHGDDSIPIARYGSSNIGMMKHIYRRGLSYRYGRTMQSIAGLHFNYSLNEALWPVLHESEQSLLELNDYISDVYFGVVRNVHRYGWLLIYLFGNSPAVSRSFFQGREALTNRFTPLDADTLYWPNATSLRMSDIGYRNDSQTTLDISFNTLDAYIRSLDAAINQPYPPYEAIGIKVDGSYRQLNAHILQIENEYYSPVRPKQVALSGEKPTIALKKRGVRYLELRAVDLMATAPEGVTLVQMHFLEVFVLWCFLTESPPLSIEEKDECNRNSLSVACCARSPHFVLNRQGHIQPITDWSFSILGEMLEIADLMDDGDDLKSFRHAVEAQLPLAADATLTPSQAVIRHLKESGQTISEYALSLTNQHRQYWLREPLEESIKLRFEQMVQTSLLRQEELEAHQEMSFDDFLKAYWLQE